MQELRTDTPEAYRATEFRNIPIDWQFVQLGDVLAVAKYGLSVRGETAGRYPILRMNNICGGAIDVTDLKYVEVRDSDAQRFRVSSLDLLFNRTNSYELVGKTALFDVEGEYLFASYLIQLRFDMERVEPRYVNYYLNWDRTQRRLKLLASRGVSQSNISASKLKTFTIVLPPLSEQRAIASILLAVQQAKEKTEAVIESAKALKKSMMKHLFTYGPVSVADWEKVPLMETEIGPVREDWRLCRISDLAQLITKGASPKWQGFDYVDRGIVFVRSQNVDRGWINLADIVYLPESWNRKEKRSVIAKGDLLVNIVGASIGRAAVANEAVDGGNLNQAVALVRMPEEEISKYVMYFLLSEQGQVQLHLQEKEIARANLSLQDIGRLPFPMSSASERRDMVELLLSIDRKIASEENTRYSLECLFKTVLRDLMTGKIRVAAADKAAEVTV